MQCPQGLLGGGGGGGDLVLHQRLHRPRPTKASEMLQPKHIVDYEVEEARHKRHQHARVLRRQ